MADVKQLIYIVDDEPLQAEILKDHLVKVHKCEIKVFATGEECLKFLEKDKPSIVFLDYNLDSQVRDAMNGVELLKVIKAKLPKTECVMLSGQNKIEVANQAMQHGAFEYISKGDDALQKAEKTVFNLNLLMRQSWDSPTSPERAELVFANRNKEFGAYVIRKGYNKTTAQALLISLAVFTLLISGPVIMNFLNPGLLGSMEFFRNEFATPIDKFGEQDQKEHLRKLLYPFILRRTKEQVAKDLPEKTETILFCEMEKEQRKIYEAYRNSYRDKIMGTIDQQGIDKSQLTILQGLMKLRQICDSPAILNEEDKYPNHSIKLDELSREIEENIGEHKALIFSQFLGMLALIKAKLKEHHIPFEYFDGSTSPTDREKAIQNFQNNDECRVFLISLKAGGVGLNLTAADYVYIVDPWWNPAVEQQAIDRTHRIGQTKNIFAYRMICIDTIEDKILQLQERKKTLAKELIADDSSFVKALTKADVEYLFS